MHQVKESSLLLESNRSLTLAVAEMVGRGLVGVRLSEECRRRIAAGRRAFEELLTDGAQYIYGASTAPGNRGKTLLSIDDARRQGETLGRFLTSRPGVGGRRLPTRLVRMAILARLANSLSGQGKLTVGTVEAIAGMLDGPAPEVPRDGLAGPGEVMALSWLLSPIADRPLAFGEAMALVNGSPFASAMVADVALTARRRLRLAEEVFALSAEAARIPREHFSPHLADLWPEPTYAAALHRLDGLLQGGSKERMPHQAPVSWRTTPNLTAVADGSVIEAERVADISLSAVKDNPTFLPARPGLPFGVAISSGGYQDQFASRSIDGVNAAFADLCTLASRQAARLVSGTELGLPHLLAPCAAEGIGTEYLIWTLTASLTRARQAAVPAGIDLGLEDPGGNQSDIAHTAFIAYDRHLDVAAALDECLGVLTMASALALTARGEGAPPKLADLWTLVNDCWDRKGPTRNASGEPLRAIVERFNQIGDGGGASSTRAAGNHGAVGS